jgi:hypothetical protein
MIYIILYHIIIQNKNEVMFYANLALSIIYDDFINNYDYEDRIFKHLTHYFDDEEDL